MSIKIMEAVWNSDIDSKKTLILLCLADHANSEGFCWPSYSLLMKKSRVKSKTTMSAHLKELEEMGYISSRRRQKSNKRLSNIYQINLGKLGLFTDSENCDFEGPEIELAELEGPEIGPPKVQKLDLTYMNRHIEPSLYVDDVENADVSPSKSTNKYGKNKCPHEKIVEIYHEILHMMPQVKILTEQRKKLIQARWDDRWKADKYKSLEDGLAYWKSLFDYISKSDFLTGGAGNFIADLEWIVRPTNFAKIIENKYHREVA